MRRITIYKPKQVTGRQSGFSLALDPGSAAALNSHFQVPPPSSRAAIRVISRVVRQQDELSPDHGRQDVVSPLSLLVMRPDQQESLLHESIHL